MRHSALDDGQAQCLPSPVSNQAATDDFFLRRALQLARRGLGRTSPNPCVGAVLVRGGKVIGEGWHRRAGLPHAEVEALRDAARRGERGRGATLYVTLEPCCTHGRTPPCTQAILEAGLRRVVVGAVDPNPHHAGRGLTLLREAGLDVVEGVCQAEAEALNPGFNHWIVHRRPLVTLKAAMTLDGKIATTRGDSRWITGEASRRVVMRLRQEHDAILVGIGTVLADDPALTARGPAGQPLSQQPLPVVLGRRAIPDAANVGRYMRRLSARPHFVGSAYNKDNAEWMLARFREWGWEADRKSTRLNSSHRT